MDFTKSNGDFAVLRSFLSITSAFTGFFTRRLRHQIVIPYLVLATVLAMVGTYLLVNSTNQSLHERFNKQLLDAAKGASDSLAQSEVQQIAGLRAMIYTEGFSEALSGGNRNKLSQLAAPQALNYGFDRVVVVSSDAVPLVVLPQQPGQNSAVVPTALTSLANAALHPFGTLDKVSALVSTSDGSFFYTAGPVRSGDKTVGAVLVGTDIARLLRQVERDSLSDGAVFYGRAGAPVDEALTVAKSPQSITPLPANWYDDIVANPQAPVRFRTLSLPDGTYLEALGIVQGRGMSNQPPGVYGVMLSTRALDSRLQDNLGLLLLVFGFALVAIIVTGGLLATWIDRPVNQLVAASRQVAIGNLDISVSTARRDELGVLAMRFNDMVDGLRQLLFVKDLFGRFVSPEVSARLLGGQVELGGEQRTVTILFSDLREFTRLSEEHSAHEIVDLLNEYFRIIIHAARQNGGIVNKFGGDSTLIVFGAPMDMADHADRALATAIAMRNGLAALNAHRSLEGWEVLRQGIGINTGPVIAGQVGSEDRMEYTVIGDAVNLASRLQAMTKDLPGCDIVFSEATHAAIVDPSNFNFSDQGLVEVRGKQQEVHIYALLGSAPEVEALPIGAKSGVLAGKSGGSRVAPAMRRR